VSSASVKSKHVLIGLSDAAQLKSYSDALTREGYRVTGATTALACWTELECQRPDVLVLENTLPWGGGDGVLAMLDEEPGIRNVPVIYITRPPVADSRPVAPQPVESAFTVPNREYLNELPSVPALVTKVRRLSTARAYQRSHGALFARPAYAELQAVAG
jgi:CheY-like chemotaxis protein